MSLGHNSTHNLTETYADPSHTQLPIKLSQCLALEGAVGAGDEWGIFLKVKQLALPTFGRAKSA